MGLIATERVVVRTRVTELDDLGEPVSTHEEETPVDAVVCPGATDDMDATHPSGITVAYTVHLPKGWDRPLRGATVAIRGEDYEVVGDPVPYTAENVPGRFSLPVEVTRSDG